MDQFIWKRAVGVKYLRGEGLIVTDVLKTLPQATWLFNTGEVEG